MTVSDEDTQWAIFSVAFVLGYFIFHLKSPFLGLCSMTLILLSFPTASVIYSYVLQVKFYGSVHSLVIFLVLGISADNMFVIFDAWKITEQHPQLKESKIKRMAFTLNRSFKSLSVTSTTAFIAFLSNFLSDIMPISAFGMFAAIIIPINFVVDLTIFPAIVIFYEANIERRICKKFCDSKKTEVEDLD